VSQRVRRVNEQVREVLAEAVPGLKDPRIGFLTLTDVRTSPDLRHAEVFYTVLPDDEESLAATADGLASAQPVLRRELAARLRMRYVPDLSFTHDPVPERGRRIDRILAESRDSDVERVASATHSWTDAATED
jgi:ribosome-binding factor A